jgi:hypothetical protein
MFYDFQKDELTLSQSSSSSNVSPEVNPRKRKRVSFTPEVTKRENKRSIIELGVSQQRQIPTHFSASDKIAVAGSPGRNRTRGKRSPSGANISPVRWHVPTPPAVIR